MFIITAMNILKAHLYAIGMYYVGILIFTAVQATFELPVFSFLYSVALHRCKQHPFLTFAASQSIPEILIDLRTARYTVFIQF